MLGRKRRLLIAVAMPDGVAALPQSAHQPSRGSTRQLGEQL